MPPPRCTCAFRLYHFTQCLEEGGAAASCRGERLGRRKRISLDKEAVIAGYLGKSVDRASLPAELQADESCVLGFADDEELQVGSSLPHTLPFAPAL